MSWGENILRLRTRLGLTQRQVADAVGVTVQTISNWETGESKPRLSPEQTLALCEVLQCSLKELVAATKNSPKEKEQN